MGTLLGTPQRQRHHHEHLPVFLLSHRFCPCRNCGRGSSCRCCWQCCPLPCPCSCPHCQDPPRCSASLQEHPYLRNPGYLWTRPYSPDCSPANCPRDPHSHRPGCLPGCCHPCPRCC